MAIPVTTIQPPQIVTPQGKVDVQPQAVKEEIPAAKKISTKESANAENQMALPKNTIGVVNPPADIYQYSMNKDLGEKEASKKEALSAAFPLAASGLGSGKSGGGSNFFRNLVLFAGATVGVIFAAKKLKLSKAASGVLSSVSDLKAHVDEVVDLAKTKVLKPFNVKKTTIRVTDEASDVIKNALTQTRKLAAEAKNIEGKSPKIIIKLKENAGDANKILKEALAKNDIDSLSDDILKNIEYINLDYVSADKKSSKVIIDVINSEFSASGNTAAKGNFWDKAEKFLKDFLGD